MAIGQRIRFFRNRKGMTQKQLGEILGFSGRTSDVRMAQYEAETRIPKSDLVREMADALEVSPRALDVPDIDTYAGLMHTFFAMEDMYGLKVRDVGGEPCLSLDRSVIPSNATLDDAFHAWMEQSTRLENGEITREQYDEWRYRYPELDTNHHWSKVPSDGINDLFLKEFDKVEQEIRKGPKKKK